MNVAFVLRCDGRREYVEQTVQSVRDHVKNVQFSYGVIVDDSGDPIYAQWLDETFPELEFLHHEERRGLGGCFKSALEVLVTTGASYGFFVEDDTPLIGDVDIQAMATVLQPRTNLAQLMLMRPPFNAEEIAAGGVYQLTPDAFTERTAGAYKYVTHEKWFGFQPFLCTQDVARYMLDTAENFLELGVTQPLKAAGFHFGYWGGLNDPPLCNHSGVTRSEGYRW